ncbi:PP2C family protein-serine/threonine phosphatase [Serratia fonticola]
MISLLNSGFFSYPKDIERGNQDSYLLPKAIDNGFVFAVADGVGSYLGAKEAADIATSQIGCVDSESLRNVRSPLEMIKNKIDGLVEEHQEWLNAATTLSYCFIDGENLYIGHIGDTRVYARKNNKIIPLTKDHTQHQELLDEGIYTKRELKDLPGRNVLTAALSRQLTLRFQSEKVPLSDIADDSGIINLYLMSDGAHHFWDKRPRFSPETLMKAPRFAASLLRRIESNGAIDDYTLIAVSFAVTG